MRKPTIPALSLALFSMGSGLLLVVGASEANNTIGAFPACALLVGSSFLLVGSLLFFMKELQELFLCFVAYGGAITGGLVGLYWPSLHTPIWYMIWGGIASMFLSGFIPVSLRVLNWLLDKLRNLDLGLANPL